METDFKAKEPECEPETVVVASNPECYSELQRKILRATIKIYNEDKNKDKVDAFPSIKIKNSHYGFRISDIANIVFLASKSTYDQRKIILEEMRTLSLMRKKVVYKSSFSGCEHTFYNPIDYDYYILTRTEGLEFEWDAIFDVNILEWFLL